MSEQEKMSEQEAKYLNERLAMEIGWRYREMPDEYSDGYWTPPAGTPRKGHYDDFSFLPDFIRDPHAFGWLLEWLGDTGLDLFDGKMLSGCHCEWSAVVGRNSEGQGRSPGEAVVRAILAYTEAQE